MDIKIQSSKVNRYTILFAAGRINDGSDNNRIIK